jgi:roadblock/LC7 domain-containing protein
MGLIMKKLSCLLILAAALSSSAWAADCKIPRTPGKIPDGATAARADMVAAKKVVDQYNESMNAYLACIKAEHEADLAKYPSADEKLKEQFVERFTKKNDAAVDEAQQFIERFNEQLRAFKAQPAK